MPCQLEWIGMEPVPAGDEESFRHALRYAQLTALLELGYGTYSLNLFVAMTVGAIYYATDGWSDWLLYWSGLNGVMIVTRVLLQSHVHDHLETLTEPQTGLRLMTASAFAGGVVWACLPLLIPDLDLAGRHSYVVLIMAGAIMASMVRGIPHSPIATMFALPPLLSIAIVLTRDGDAEADILAVNMLVLALVLHKSCRLGAANFLATVAAGVQATDLAASLKIANAEAQEKNKALEILANYDPLTGLANRGRLQAQLRFSLACARPGDRIALFILDLDRFKQINDTLGHAAGDALLNEVARRLTSALDGTGLAARLGGDEFAVLIAGPDHPDRLLDLAQHCLDIICQPMLLNGRVVPIHSSLGFALWPDHAETAEELYAYADMALYESKNARKMCAVGFSRDMKLQSDRQRQIEQDLRRAIERGELQAWFQPQVRIADHAVVGFEALVRWPHPELGLVNPHEVVHSSEILHQTRALARSMLEKSCRLIKELDDRGLALHATVAINISPRDFTIYDVPELLRSTTDLYGVPRDRFEVELTEEAELEPERIHGALKQIAQSGFKLSIDDFGMGHTSLNHLLSINVDRMKIDRSFVNGIAGNLQNQALVSAMVALGRMLSIDILVEGVESSEDLKTLRQLGCHTAQGYLFAAPMPHADLVRWLEERAGSRQQALLRP